VFNADKLGAAHGQCWAQFADEITKGCSLVIVDNTNLVYKDLKKYYEFATSAGYDVEIVAVECLPEIAAARNVHNVPEKTILKMAARFQTCLNHVKANGWKLHVIQGSSPGEQAITS
jgi:predicted kinase